MSDSRPATIAAARRAAAATDSSRRTLFVGGLPETFTSEDLSSLFGRHGHVVEGEVMYNGERASRCFGFVTMQATDLAARAKAALDGTRVPGLAEGRSIKVRWALSSRTLLVGDLGPDVKLDQLQEAFQQFGDVLNVRLEKAPREMGGRPKGFGFVEYNQRSVAAKVQQLLSDNLFLVGASPQPVHVEFALDEGGADAPPVDPSLALQPPPHFAQPGTLEFDFALKWRELTLAQKAEEARLADLHRQVSPAPSAHDGT